jgi:transposase
LEYARRCRRIAGRSAAVERAVIIGLEATGHYWLAVYEALVGAGHTVQVLNPLQTHA